ncbi:MAG: glycine zipper 2TM domain-containing protein [Pseudomonadota bacterium]
MSTSSIVTHPVRTPGASRWRVGAPALAVVAALGLAAAAPVAHADDDDRYEYGHKHKWKDRGRYDDRYYDGGYRDARYPSRGSDYAWARVVDVHPRVRQVRVEVPTRECWDETEYAAPRPRQGVAGPMILGGAIGAAVGNQIGRGDGRRAATVAGARFGSAIGHDVGERRRDRYEGPPRAYTVERCDTRYETRYDERIEGYDVTYEYDGRRFQTRLPYDPGNRMRVRVDVAPAER